LTAVSELLLTMMLDNHTHKNLLSRSKHLHTHIAANGVLTLCIYFWFTRSKSHPATGRGAPRGFRVG